MIKNNSYKVKIEKYKYGVWQTTNVFIRVEVSFQICSKLSADNFFSLERSRFNSKRNFFKGLNERFCAFEGI